MKKILKILLITVISLISIVIITVSIALWLIFTPARLTPIVHKQTDKFISCQTEIGEIELTLFSTFPNFGITIRDFSIINPLTGAQSDTLVSLDEITGIVDAKAWWKNNEIILTGIDLQGGVINVFSDSLGKTNYDIFNTDVTSEPESIDKESDTINPVIDIRSIALRNIDISYIDLSSKMQSDIRDLDAKVSGIINPDSISGEIKVKSPSLSFSLNGEPYLTSTSVDIDIPADFVPAHQVLRLKNAMVSLNSLELMLNGIIENDTINKNIITDLSYKLKSWPVADIISLVPPSFTSYLKGVDADGILSSQGTVKGILNDSVMPLMDIKLQMENGTLKYADFPLPLHDIEGNFAVYTDLKNDAISYLNINNFAAKTPSSSVNITGQITRLFSDIQCNVVTTAALKLDEFRKMIPDSLNLKASGRVEGKIRSLFSMSQLEKMQIEKMKLSGSVRLSQFFADYDSIAIRTDRSDIEFALPNLKAETKNTKFAFARIKAVNLDATKPGEYNASLGNATITLETSDARDTTKIPYLLCSFSMDTLSAGTDTLHVSVSSPSGKIDLAPSAENPDQLHINLSYISNHLLTIVGENTVDVKSINVASDIINDNSQKDIFLQWMAKGSVEMEGGTINVAGLSYPLEIPSVKMNFDPEVFNIKESSFKLGNSDFQLKGNLSNILSYFRNDSILRGDFSFNSNATDIDQLMALTNGLGQSDSIKVESGESQDADTSYTGPYMVPKGIDLFLTTNIKKVTMGIDTATNIIGSVQVHDGILVLDGLSFKTPAARMQLTAMYRTPRKNHLYLGLDYHMLDIEIEKLLSMIPDIDTLMPMLRSFRGKGEFHIAVETYLDSMYNVKKSTLRGASSIKGTNLVLMDGETFSEIAKTLRFSKHAENRVDSLSAEFTIFRNEIDIYPFLIVMDRYKAVIAGRHNFDMSFDYHVSVVDCPVPIKLGVDVIGSEEALKYNLAKCRYAEFYRPASRRAVENKQLELRQMIRDALTRKVNQ